MDFNLAKNLAQEYCQKRSIRLPVYRTILQTGPSHSPIFQAEVEIDGTIYVGEIANKKRDAEKHAAVKAMIEIRQKKMNKAEENVVSIMPNLSIKTGKEKVEAVACSVCLCPIACGSDVPLIECLHNFHTECLQKWLETKEECPLCRYKIMNADDRSFKILRN
ncbi:unnamed protein product [Didymodactylos carnosus]|uniref:Uncharacterized protein n=1 Tax=Didymodactylos carnosus TaxID=1234261 RepID=A0A814P087_9BILA|nr:unnamed protein product [Didymodactylos carnosus]CAF3864461.1 unnamed protein product [Didymodactylos carnosus]